MFLSIAHDISSMTIHRNLFNANRSMAKSIEKLSSGYRINTAADGQVSLYALEGAQSWPYEWTPKRDEEFEEFDIEQFLSLTAQGGQEIEATENGQTLVITLGT